jgi:hypothetical protein
MKPEIVPVPLDLTADSDALRAEFVKEGLDLMRYC